MLAVAGTAVPPKLPTVLSGPLRGADIAQFVALRAAACVGADYSNLAIVNVEAHGSVRLYHGTFLDSEAASRYTDLHLDAGFPITEAVRTNEAIVLEGESAYRDRFPAIWDETIALGVRATMSMPLCRNDGSVIGAIGFAWAEPPAFDLKLETALTALAHLVAEIVQRAEVYEAEHQMISDLHRRLLSDLPKVEGLRSAARYLPAGQSSAIGGDWYEGIVLDNGSVAIVVGDVVGHGLTAAADMALIRGMVTALVHDGVAIEDVFARVSRVLQRRPEDLLATAALAVIDLRAETVSYSTAGHPAPLVLSPDGTVTPLDGANAPMLGVGACLSTAAVAPFPAGSKLVMYTDGLVESRMRAFDEGIRALQDLLGASPTDERPDELIDRVLAALVTEFPAHDDIAVVVVEHVGGVTRIA